ncbi:F-box/WD repeat-containing protein 12 [Ambystoma mexicanum]|uniref:F-box/WD repeat-containing protein 12 n=1 Tax=Ambystoma mexicanum TaxID=8296 RepID=UPI0037E70B7F
MHASESDAEMAELTLDCLVCIFSYLNAEQLLVSATVCKVWNEAADASQLWRRMCMRRWTFCNIANLIPGMQTWKKYYLHRSQLEHQMTSGRGATDYTCKTMRGHDGHIVAMAYLSENEHEFESGTTFVSVVCTASTDRTIRAWNIQEGSQLWSSPVQQEGLSQMIAMPQEKLVLSSDIKGTIKVWNGQLGEELASFSTNTSKCVMVAYTLNGNTFLSAGIAGGIVYTLAVPALNEISRERVYTDDGIDLLLCSPDKQWIVAAKLYDLNQLPKIFCRDSLTNPTKDEPTISSSLPINGCVAACWLPTEAARIAVINRDQECTITTLNIMAKKYRYKTEIIVEQIARFALTRTGASTLYIQGHGAETLLLASGTELYLYSISGSKLASFKDHTEDITSICVDPFRVITSSMDLSLRVYTWKTENKMYSLTSRYHLLGGSHRFSRRIASVACDFVSIATTVDGTDEKSILRAYSFNI